MRNSVTPRDPLARRIFADFQFFRMLGCVGFGAFCVFKQSVTPQTCSVTPTGGHAAAQGGQWFKPSVTCDPLFIKLGRLIYSWGVYILVHKCFRGWGVTGHGPSQKLPKPVADGGDMGFQKKFQKIYKQAALQDHTPRTRV